MQAYRMQDIVNRRILLSLARTTSKQEYLDAIVAIIADITGCRYVGIRKKTKDNLIPYVSYRGFTPEFLANENWISLETHNCACARVVTGQFIEADKNNVTITPGGSFVVLNASRVLNTMSPEDKTHYRWKCLGSRFGTIILFPIRQGGQVVGAIHLADEQENLLSTDMIQALEDLTPVIGEVLIRYDMEQTMQLNASFLQELIPELFKKKDTKEEYLELIIAFIRRCCNASSVGVRMLDDQGLLPYIACHGISEAFCEAENHLSINEADCACTRVLAGKPEPQDLPVMTPGGSFYCPLVSEFDARLTPRERTRFRGACLWEGYQTTVIIPLTQAGLPIGAIHIADRMPYAISLETVQYLEMIAPIIGEALQKFKLLEEKDNLDKQLQRLEKLSLVGEMAAGIGHEIRNPMTTVRGLLQHMSNKTEDVHQKQYFSLMIEELDCANAIITEYLSLASNKRTSKQSVNLSRMIQKLQPLIAATCLENNVELHLELAEVPEILLDKNEIKQLLLNLTRNSIEAMPSGGTLTLRTGQRDSHRVILEVEDQGKGIPKEILENIGMPFVTTKNNGTGLGLAVCYSIAARHNAKIHFATNDQGTICTVVFDNDREKA